MRILVCVKHVPDLASTRRFGADRRTVRDAADSTLNEVDENAVEEALRIPGENEVIALTIGPAIAVDAVRRALQMGVHTAVHVQDEALAGLDAPATAAVLAAAIRRLAPIDVVLTGMTALDGLGSVVPSLLGAELGWGVLSGAQELTLHTSGTPRSAEIARDLDGAAERLRADLPAIIAVSDAINSPRLPKTKDILAARSAEVTRLTLADLDVEGGAVASRTVVTRAEETPPRPAPVVVHDTGDGGRELARFLIDHDLLGDAR